MNWSWKVVYDVLPQMLEGLVITVQATIIGALVAYALGLILAIMRMSNSRIISLSTYWISECSALFPFLRIAGSRHFP